MTTSPEPARIQFSLLHPAAMTAEERAQFPEVIQAGLQRAARAQGLSIPEDPAEADVQRIGFEQVIVDTDDGPVEARKSTYSAVAVGMPTLPDALVQAVENEGGIWIADLPTSGVIVRVRHGLDSLDVQVRALAADKTTAGIQHFLPIEKDEVEVIGLPGAAHVVIEHVPDPEAE